MAICEKRINLIKMIDNKLEVINDLVAKEKSFSIFLNEKKLVTLNCSPNHYRSLGLGYLVTRGEIFKKDQIKDIKIDIKKGRMFINLEKEPDSGKRYEIVE